MLKLPKTVWENVPFKQEFRVDGKILMVATLHQELKTAERCSVGIGRFIPSQTVAILKVNMLDQMGETVSISGPHDMVLAIMEKLQSDV